MWMIYDYVSIRRNLRNFESTRQEYTEKKQQLETVLVNFEKVQLDLDRLENLSFRLRAYAGVQERKIPNQFDEESLRVQQNQASREGILDVIDTHGLNVDLPERNINTGNLLAFFNQKRNPLYRIPNGRPVKGFLMQKFGIRSDPFSGQRRPHHGLAIAAREFSPVIAPADGIVLFSGEEGIYGTLLILDHGNGIVTRYGHLAQTDVREGDLVTRGDTIAQVGSTGQTTGPQLYYEVRLNNIPQDPMLYMDENEHE